MSAAETIFRFVTVRGPRKPTTNELATGFIRYDAGLRAPLIEQVSQATASAAGSRQVRAAAQDYVRGTSFIGSPEDLARLSRDLAELADDIAASATTVTADSITARTQGRDIASGDEVRRVLWDSLLAHTVVGGAPEAREQVIWALRAINLLQAVTRRPDDDTLRRMATATVLLPASVHVGPPQLEREAPHEPPPPPEGSRPGIASAVERISAYRAAHAELSAQHQAELERTRAADVPPPQVPQIDSRGCVQVPQPPPSPRPAAQHSALGDSILRRLSEPTRQVVESLKIEPGTRIPYVLSRIQDVAARIARDAATGASATTRVVLSGGTVWSYSPTSPVQASSPAPQAGRVDLEYGGMYAKDACRVKPLGIADFRRVDQTLWCYEPGEVAHIENVLIGETKERKTRMLRRSESILTVETDEETTKERDTQTTDRFEVQKEADKVVKDDLSFALGVQVSGQYGVVKIQADTKFAVSQSTTESDKEASKYGKEVSDRAVEKVVKKVREAQTQKLLEEYEETNAHGFDNKGGTAHIVGLYRWVDKFYQATVVNYGKRLMFEFTVPEPAAFHLYALATAPVDGQLTLEKPLDPRSPEAAAKLGVAQLASHTDIDEFNFALWASAYDAKVDPPPAQFVTVDKAYNREGLDQGTQFSDSKNDFKVPDGYEATQFFCEFGYHAENDNWITIMIGRSSVFRHTSDNLQFQGALSGTEEDFVPIVVMGKTRMYGLDVEVQCQRLPATLEAWQIKTFDAIVKGYQDRLGAYQTALADAKAHQDTQVRGTNPDLNRQTEQTELKKACIRLLDPHCHPVASEAMRDGQDCGYPEFDCCTAITDGSYVQFVEQAFEWSIMTYLFYPYFWGRKCNWSKIYQVNDPDPLFLAFLQAGYARVVVPVRPGYEEAVLRFLVDGQPWNGGSAPGVDSPLYVSIVNEMKEPVSTIDPDIKPWQIKVPTTLTVLQCDSGCTPGTGLPCPHGQEP